MMKKIFVAIGLSSFALAAFAFEAEPIVKSVDLRDGTTVHMFSDGKMAMENAYGKVTSMDDGHVMEAKNGEKIVMKGNETERLRFALRPQYRY